MTEEGNKGPTIFFKGNQPAENLESFIEVEATANKEDGSQLFASVFYPFGKDIDDAVGRYSAAVVFSNFRAQAKIKLQSLMRARMLKGLSIQELVEKWKPGIQLERIPADPIAAAEATFASMSTDEQEAFLQRLIDKQKAA